MDAYFERRKNGFMAGEFTRGPWSPNHQHGSPSTALLGKILQEETELCLARLTVEILRPIPIGLLTVEVSRLRPGRMAQIYGAILYANGKELVRATGLFLKQEQVEFEEPDLQDPAFMAPQDSVPDQFPFLSEGVGFEKSMDIRLARGTYGQAQVAAWMKLKVALIKGESVTPLDRALITADCGNGLSAFLDINKYTFINPDLTIYLNRLPHSEWVCVDASTRAQTNGIAFSDSRLFDEEGMIGRANQSLLIRELPPR